MKEQYFWKSRKRHMAHWQETPVEKTSLACMKELQRHQWEWRARGTSKKGRQEGLDKKDWQGLRGERKREGQDIVVSSTLYKGGNTNSVTQVGRTQKSPFSYVSKCFSIDLCEKSSKANSKVANSLISAWNSKIDTVLAHSTCAHFMPGFRNAQWTVRDAHACLTTGVSQSA